jgi:hypothetical protein
MVKEPLGEAWRFMRTMGREGDLTKLAKAAVILPVAGALIHKMKEQTFKAVGVHFYEELLAGKSSPLKVLTWMANAGTFGLALDVISALKYGERGIVGVLGGPSISDIVNIVEAGTKTGVEIFKSIQYKSGDWLKQRGPAIRDYWLKFGERLTPDARIAIQGLFKDWRFAKSARNWTDVYKKATTKYKELYLMKGTDDAEIFWDAWMATQGTEYYEIFNKYPKKPTEKEIARWWEEKGKGAAESINLPGESEDKKQIGQFLW